MQVSTRAELLDRYPYLFTTPKQHNVARLHRRRRDRVSVLDYTNPGSVDKDSVALASVHDLGIAGH